MRILITGATGFLGSHLYRHLSKNHHVIGFARSLKKWQNKKLSGNPILGSLKDCPPLTEHKAFDIIVHTAGLLISHQSQKFYQVNQKHFATFLERMKSHSPNAYFINIGSLASLGPGEGYREDAPVSHYGKSKKAAEEELKQLWPEKKWISLRPPIIMGPEDEGMLEVFQQVQKGIMLYAGFKAKKNKYHFIHSQEIVNLVDELITKPLDGIYYTFHPRVITHQEMLEEIHHFVRGKRVRNFILPQTVIKLAGWLCSTLKLKTQLTSDKTKEICASKWLCPQPNVASFLNYQYKMDLSQTIASTAKSYQEKARLRDA